MASMEINIDFGYLLNNSSKNNIILNSEMPMRKSKPRDPLETVDFNYKIQQMNMKKQKLIDVIGVRLQKIFLESLFFED